MGQPKLSKKQWAYYIGCLFLFQEIIFRLVIPVPEICNFDRVLYMELGSSNQNLQYSRNTTWTWQSALDTNHVFNHHMNLYGFRDKEWTTSKPQGKKRIVFIGDSFVEGMMAENDQKFTDYFKQKDQNDEFDVLNAGVAGIGLTANMQLSADIIPMLSPDIAVLCIYSNDMGKKEPLVPSHYLEPESYNFFTPRLLEFFNQKEKHGPILANVGNNKRAYFKPVPDATNPWTKYEALFSKSINDSIGSAMKLGKLNPFLVNSFIKEERCLRNKPLLGETVPFFKYMCEQNSVIPVIVYIPSRNQITNHYSQYELQMCLDDMASSFDLTAPQYNQHQNIIKSQCAQFKVPFYDLTETLKKEELGGNHLFWNYDQHMKAKGYKLIGNNLHNFISKNIRYTPNN